MPVLDTGIQGVKWLINRLDYRVKPGNDDPLRDSIGSVSALEAAKHDAEKPECFVHAFDHFGDTGVEDAEDDGDAQQQHTGGERDPIGDMTLLYWCYRALWQSSNVRKLCQLQWQYLLRSQRRKECWGHLSLQ